MSHGDGYLEKDVGTVLQWSEQYTRGNINTGQPNPAFAPIDHASVSIEGFNLVKTTKNRSIDSATLYDIPEDITSNLSPLRGKKRAFSRSINSRRVSLCQVWEYADDEDNAYQSATKRRKPIIERRTKSMGLQANAPIQNDGPIINETDKQETFQLTAPLDIEKSRKRPAPLKRKTQEIKMNSFKSPVITKPMSKSPRRKGIEDDSLLRPVSTYQGFTTTEETVKLSKTTLDKLTAFRYRSSSGDSCTETLPSGISQLKPSTILLSSKQNEITNFTNQNRPDSQKSLQNDDYPFGRNKVPFQNLGKVNTRIEQADHIGFLTHLETLQNVSQNGTYLLHPPLDIHNSPDSRHLMQTDYQDECQLEVRRCPPSLRESSKEPSLGQEAYTIQLKPHPPSKEHYAFEYDDLTSSELVAIAGLIEPSDIARPDAPLASETDESCLLALPATHKGPDETTRQDPRFHHDGEFKEIAKPLTSSQSEMQVFKEISLPVESAIYPQWPHHPILTRFNSIQVERSDIEGDYEVLNQVSKHFDDNEFDEGLNDSDFLAIASDAVITQMPTSRTVDTRSVGSSSGLSATSMLLNSTEPTKPNKWKEGYSTTIAKLQTTNFEGDDEYSVDEDLERELCNISELSGGIMERAIVPTSLQLSFVGSPTSDGVYDSRLQFSPLKSMTPTALPTKVPLDGLSENLDGSNPNDNALPVEFDDEDWDFIRLHRELNTKTLPPSQQGHQKVSDVNVVVQRQPSGSLPRLNLCPKTNSQRSRIQPTFNLTQFVLDDSHEYEPLSPFARPGFPNQTLDRSPIIGLSPGPSLRVCFRIGEMLKEGSRCNSLKQNVVIELFARVTFSSRETGTTKQHFQFADMWHDRPPFPNGVLANYKSTSLAESESRAFIGSEEGMMARCLGRVKREGKTKGGWVVEIINIRQTDWEEIRWTKRIVSAGMKEQTRVASKL